MNKLTRHVVKAIVMMVVCGAGTLPAKNAAPAPPPPGGWSEPVEVRYESTLCVTYRARLAGDFVIIQAKHEPGWHTFAMDNKQRADEKLGGKESLGLEGPTEIKVTGGLQPLGPWYQSPPKDLSKPELRWFTWGFEGESLFAAKVRRASTRPALVTVRGQACSNNLCKQIDITIPLLAPAGRAAAPATVNLKTLIRVRI